MVQSAVIAQYLQEIVDKGQVSSDEDLDTQRRMVRQVIERLITVDQVLLAEEGQAAESSETAQDETETDTHDKKRTRGKKSSKKRAKDRRILTVNPNLPADAANFKSGKRYR